MAKAKSVPILFKNISHAIFKNFKTQLANKCRLLYVNSVSWKTLWVTKHC